MCTHLDAPPLALHAPKARLVMGSSGGHGTYAYVDADEVSEACALLVSSGRGHGNCRHGAVLSVPCRGLVKRNEAKRSGVA